MYRILIVDDDPIALKVMVFILSDQGYEVTAHHSPSEALEELNRSAYDLIILAIHLPEMDGQELCRRIRLASSTPIIVVSALVEVKDMVASLRVGADDYIPKPFDPNELLARIWAKLRRNLQLANSESHMRTPDLVLNPLDNQVVLARDGKTVDLTPIEARLMLVLVCNPGQTITRDTLLAKVWNHEYQDGSNQLDVHIMRLRTKIEENPSEPKLLLTVRGVGYKYLPSTHLHDLEVNVASSELAPHQ